MLRVRESFTCDAASRATAWGQGPWLRSGVTGSFFSWPPPPAYALADVLMEHRIYLASWGCFSPPRSRPTPDRAPAPARRPVFLVALCRLCAALATATYLRVGLWQSSSRSGVIAVAKSSVPRRHLAEPNGLSQLGATPAAVGFTPQTYPRMISEILSPEIRGKLASSLLLLGRTDESRRRDAGGLARTADRRTLLGPGHGPSSAARTAAAEAAAEASVRAARVPALLSKSGDGSLRQGRSRGRNPRARASRAPDPDEHRAGCSVPAYPSQGPLNKLCTLLRACHGTVAASERRAVRTVRSREACATDAADGTSRARGC